MEEEDEWGEFGGFESATEGVQPANQNQTLSWAASFQAMPNLAFSPIVSAEPSVHGNTFPASSYHTPASIPFAIPNEEIGSGEHFNTEEKKPPLHTSHDEEVTKDKIAPVDFAVFPSQESAVPNDSPIRSGMASTVAENSAEKCAKEPSAISEKECEDIQKLNVKIVEMAQEKETIEAKLAHTLLLLDEQKKRNQEMQRKIEEEIQNMENQSKVTIKLLLEEHTRQTKEAILENQQRCLLESKTALDGQADEMRRQLQAQKEAYEESLRNKEKQFAEESTDMLSNLREEFEKQQNSRMEEKEKTWQETFEAKLQESLKLYIEEATEKFNQALGTEREEHRKHLAEERANFETEMEEQKTKFETSCKKRLEDQRDAIWESVQTMLSEERQKWKQLSEAVREETQKRTTETLEQKYKIDSLSRRGRLLGMDVLLANIKEQLHHVMSAEEDTAMVNKSTVETLVKEGTEEEVTPLQENGD